MKRHTISRHARFLCAAVPVCLLLSSCDPVDSQSARIPLRYKAPKLDTRRTGVSNPENARWMAAWSNLREEISPLQEKLAGLQEFHARNRFDSFLTLDPETLDNDQLCTLYHFLERGYFTVERRILIDLLKRRLNRSTDPAPATADGNAKLKDVFAAAMHRDEIRMVDIETAIDYYSKAGTGDIQIPNSLSDVEHEQLLTAVNGMLERTRSEIARMDATLKYLKAKAFPSGDPNEALPEPPEEPDASAEVVSVPPPEVPAQPAADSDPEETLFPVEAPELPSREDVPDSSEALLLDPDNNGDPADSGDSAGPQLP